MPHKFCPLSSTVYTVPDNCSHMTNVMIRSHPKRGYHLATKSQFLPKCQTLLLRTTCSRSLVQFRPYSDEIQGNCQSRPGLTIFNRLFSEKNCAEMAKKEGNASKDTNFTWTDEETTLLIQVVIDYKAAKMAKGLDWETVKTKYD